MTSSNIRIQPLRLLLYLTPFIVSFAFALDIYIPIIAEMRRALHTNQVGIQLTLTLFLATNGVGQLFLGPLSDHLGRRPMLVLCAILYIIGNSFCALAGHLFLLIGARIITALGACGMLVTANAIIRDCYHGKMSARLYSLTSTVVGISPIFAPIIGGYLAHTLGLRAVFWFLTLLGVLALCLAIFVLEETRSAAPTETVTTIELHALKKRWKGVVRHYLTILSNPTFRFYAFIASCAISIFFAFFSISPIIIIENFKIKIDHFGYYFTILGLTVAVGGLLNAKWVNYLSIQSAIHCGLVLISCGGLLMWLCPSTLTGFILTFIPIGLGAIFLVSSGASGAMEPFGERPGYAAAMLGFIEFFFGAAAGSILILFPIHSTHIYAYFVMVIAIVAVLQTLYTYR